MLTEQVSPDITRVRLGFYPGVNAYLVREPDGYTLVDTGFFPHGRVIERLLPGLRVKRIVLTHYHPDHSGGAAYLQRVTRAPVLVHAADLPFVCGQKWFDEEPGWAVARFMFKLVRLIGLGRTEPPEEVVALQEGDRVGRLQVLHTPGHTPGSCSLWDGEQTLFCGDNLVNLLRFGVGIPIWTLDHALQRRSIARYEGLGARLVLSGHGRPWRGDLDAFVRRLCSRWREQPPLSGNLE